MQCYEISSVYQAPEELLDRREGQIQRQLAWTRPESFALSLPALATRTRQISLPKGKRSVYTSTDTCVIGARKPE